MGRIDGDDLALRELVERASRGDAEAWSELDRRYRGWLARTIHRRLGRRSRRRFDTEDVVQATFARAIQGCERLEYRGEGALRGWFQTILTRTYYEMLRHERARGHDGTPTVLFDPTAIEGRGVRPSQNLAARELEERSLELLARLPDDEHCAVTLRNFEGRTWREIGEELGCRPETAKERYWRGFQRILKQL